MVNRPLRIRMDVDFESFDEDVKNEFLTDLSDVSGVPLEELVVTGFYSGCVIFEGELNREAIARLLEQFKQAEKGESSQDIEPFIEFLEKWSVSSIKPKVRLKIEEDTEDGLSAKDIVIFIHGWNGSNDSFGSFPSYIAGEIVCETAVYEYPTGIWANSPSLEFIARNLDNWIRTKFRNARKISIVAHSMGGIIARRFISLQMNRSDKLENIIQITFIASPHNGASLADIGKHVPTFEKVQLQELSQNSPFLLAVNSDWLTWVDSNSIERNNIRSIIGTNDKVVSINNAMGLDPNAVLILGGGHKDIVKPNSEKSEVVATLAMFLENTLFEKSKQADIPVN